MASKIQWVDHDKGDFLPFVTCRNILLFPTLFPIFFILSHLQNEVRILPVHTAPAFWYSEYFFHIFISMFVQRSTLTVWDT
jgi:hypothetical protein